MGKFALGRAFIFLCLGGLTFGSAWAADLSQPEELYKHTDFEASLKQLDKHSTDAATNFLIGRDYFMLVDFKKATDYLQLAAAEQPQNAEYLDWLGRAYGKRAETSNPLMAPGLASKARQAFERAVELDPKNSDALSDLFDYYLEAPGFLGGGYDQGHGRCRKYREIRSRTRVFRESQTGAKAPEFQAAEDHLRKPSASLPEKLVTFWLCALPCHARP